MFSFIMFYFKYCNCIRTPWINWKYEANKRVTIVLKRLKRKIYFRTTWKLQSKYNVNLKKKKNTNDLFSIESYWFTIYKLVQQILNSFVIFYASSNEIPTAILHEHVAVDFICYLIYFSLKFRYKTGHVFLKMTV